jgi:hypothetical protein
VCHKLQLTDLQAVLFADLSILYNGYCIPIHELAALMECKILQIFTFYDDFVELEQKNLVTIMHEEWRHGKKELSFEISLETFDCIQKDKAPETVLFNNLSADAFFSTLHKICGDRVQELVSYDRSLKLIGTLLDNNPQLTVVKAVKTYALSRDDEFILLWFCHYLVNLEEAEMRIYEVAKLYPHNNSDQRFIAAKRLFRARTHALQQENLIEFASEGDFADPDTFRLTEKAKIELLAELDDQLRTKTLRGLIAPDSIKAKSLFYPEKTTRQIDDLTALLGEASFASIQKRLGDTGMRTGFACLFSGAPGTGKTETVHQIARQTGRAIMQVDIAETKSMWFGGSEKRIKEVFTKYRDAVKFSKVTPILLFNEADAVIGKRQTLGESNRGAAQTENAMQNIILQEIETLKGILIATTNLTKNMDSAFERRFLYNIDFEKPTAEARKAIWHSLIPELPETEARSLASRFDFSGGQIENISRKRTGATILHGAAPSFDAILRLCDDEKHEEEARIGFGA